MEYKVVKFDMVVFGNINNDKDPPVHLNAAVKKTHFQISPVTYINKGGTVKVIYSVFHKIPENKSEVMLLKPIGQKVNLPSKPQCVV